DVAYFQSNNNKEIANLTVDYYLDQKKISLLTTRHENDVGRMMLNTKIQKRISGNTGFEKNVIILQNRNDYFHGVFKGEKGKITSMNKSGITSEFYVVRIVTISKEQDNNN